MLEKIKTIIIVILVAIIVCGGVYIVHYFRNISTGRDAVEYMYSFNNYQDLKYINMPELKKITTNSVYGNLTYDDFSNAINNYLQFLNKPTGVDILSSKNGCIKFSFINEYVSPNQEYEFLYTTDIWGNINSGKVIEVDALHSTVS